MESLRNPFEELSNELFSSEKTVNEKISAIESLRSVDSLTLDTYISFVRNLIKKLAERCRNEEVECIIFENFLTIVSDIATTSQIAPKALIDELTELLSHEVAEIRNKEFIVAILSALSRLVRVKPEAVYSLKDTFEEILQRFVDIDVYEKIFDVIEIASWILPPVFTQYKKTLKEIPETEFRDSLVNRYYKFIARVGKRNYYIIKSEVRDVINALYTQLDYNKLLLLSNISLPDEDISVARDIFDILELKLDSIEDIETKKVAITTLANISKNMDFVELQSRFVRLVNELVVSELDKDVKKTSLESISLIHWNPRVNLSNLIETISDVAINPTEEDEVRLASVEALFKISLFPQSPKSEIIRVLIQVLNSTGIADVKAEAIETLLTLARWVKDEVDDVMQSLLNVASRLDEEDFIRIKALDSLTSLTHQNPEKILNFINDIVELWNISTEWGIRDSIVKLVGEALLRNDKNIKEFLTILIQALEDSYIYREAIEYLLRISTRHPDYLVKEIDSIVKAYDTIKSVELELRDEGIDVLGGDYFYLVETSKRYLARLLTNLGTVSPESFEPTVEVLLKQFEEERNEIVEKEIAYNLAKLFERDPEKFRNILARHLLEEKKLTLLSRFGVSP